MIWIFFKGFAVTIVTLVSLACLVMGAVVFSAFLTSTLENWGMNRSDAESVTQIATALVVLGVIGGFLAVMGAPA